MSSEVLKISPQVMARQIGDEVVILDLASGNYFGLNEIGARIWDLIGQGRSVDSVYAALEVEYEVGPESLRRDVDSLVEELRGRGLLAAGPG